MFNMHESVSEILKKEGATVFLLFKPNYEFGFYYSKEQISLRQFADEVEKIELVDCYENVYSNYDDVYADITEGYIKIYYKDGTIKILDSFLNNELDFDFFEIVI